MNAEELRKLIRAKLRDGRLPAGLPPVRRITPGKRTPPRVAGGRVRGARCSACEEPDPEMTFNYPDGSIYFHHRCQRIWREERGGSVP